MCVWRAGNTLLRLLLLPRSPSISFFVAVPAHTGFPLLSMCYCVYIRCVRALSPALLLCFFFLLSFCLLSRPTRETVASLTAALLYPVNWLTENVGWELVCALDLPVFCVCCCSGGGESREGPYTHLTTFSFLPPPPYSSSDFTWSVDGRNKKKTRAPVEWEGAEREKRIVASPDRRASPPKLLSSRCCLLQHLLLLLLLARVFSLISLFHSGNTPRTPDIGAPSLITELGCLFGSFFLWFLSFSDNVEITPFLSSRLLELTENHRNLS